MPNKPRGRPFVKGNPGGPGRPKRSAEESYLNAAKAALSTEDWSKILAVAIKQALKGNSRARACLMRLAVGNVSIEQLDRDYVSIDHVRQMWQATLQVIKNHVKDPEVLRAIVADILQMLSPLTGLQETPQPSPVPVPREPHGASVPALPNGHTNRQLPYGLKELPDHTDGSGGCSK